MTDTMDISTSSIGDAFKQCTAHMKAGFPIWEDFLVRGLKLHRQLENTISAFSSFMEGLSKVADIAARGQAGGTNDIGAGLSNLVSWHRSQEFKIKEMNLALSCKLLAPLQSKIEEWKKTASHMDREHEKEVQKAVKEIRESNKNTNKTHKNLEAKLKKDKTDKVGILQRQLEQQRKDVRRLVRETEDRERENLSKVILEERRWYSGFVAGFSKSLDVEVSMFGDVDRLKNILSELGDTISQPNTLPATAKEYIENWRIPSTASPHTHKRHPSIHNSSASLTSSHSRSSIGSQDSINITAPVPPPLPPAQPNATPPGGNSAIPNPPAPSLVQPAESPSTAAPPPPPPMPPQGTQSSQHLQDYNSQGVQPSVGAQYPQGTQFPQTSQAPGVQQSVGAQYPQGTQFPQTSQAQGVQQSAEAQYPQGTQFPQYAKTSQGQGVQQSAGAQYPQGTQFPQTSQGQGAQQSVGAQYPQGTQLPQYAQTSQEQMVQQSIGAQYPKTHYATSHQGNWGSQFPLANSYQPPQYQLSPQAQAYSQLPPPPPPNFPPQPDMCYDATNMATRPLPSIPAGVAYDENFEPVSMASSMSVSPSQASLSSHQSTESGRSLSPPVGPTRSPNQTRAQLSSLQEELPSDLQSALLAKLKLRTTSTSLESTSDSSLPQRPSEPPTTLPRTSSVGSRVTAPPVAYKPPRGPAKPTRSMSFKVPTSGHNISPLLQQQNHTPDVPPFHPSGYQNGNVSSAPHHVLNPNRNSTCSSDSDVEDDSPFAKALRKKKLRKTGSLHRNF